MLVLMFALVYFMMIRPQQKRMKQMKAMHDSLQRGDEIVTVGGIHGTIDALEDTVVHVRVAHDVVMKFERQAIGSVVNKNV
ncbi:preprotein translocase subunit YajC [Savagea sp. SN6]|uniref:Preprotein translocase subunit YajC n=2 Tax=Savagea serpentis TaxID=2785297 RepID=A0A8J7G0W1_9BACL|nr:preprotein translocase subunit YajC [Savagea serpentis]